MFLWKKRDSIDFILKEINAQSAFKIEKFLHPSPSTHALAWAINFGRHKYYKFIKTIMAYR